MKKCLSIFPVIFLSSVLCANERSRLLSPSPETSPHSNGRACLSSEQNTLFEEQSILITDPNYKKVMIIHLLEMEFLLCKLINSHTVDPDNPDLRRALMKDKLEKRIHLFYDIISLVIATQEATNKLILSFKLLKALGLDNQTLHEEATLLLPDMLSLYRLERSAHRRVRYVLNHQEEFANYLSYRQDEFARYLP